MSSSQQLTIQQAISRAKKATKQGKVAIAMEIYAAILQQQPNHPIAKKRLRNLQKELSKNQPIEKKTPSPSKDQIDGIHNINSASAGPVSASAQERVDTLIALYNQNQFEEVITQATALVEKFPQGYVLHNILGGANVGLRRFDAAIKSYQRAIALNPDYADPYTNLGVAFHQKGDRTSAIKNYQRAIQIKPDNAEAHSNLGNVLKEEGNLGAAIESCNRALNINPSLAEAHSNLGAVLLETGDLAKAIKSCNRAIEINPEFAEAHCNLGNALQENGDPRAAIESYNRTLKIKPNFTMARSQRLRQQAFICDWGAIKKDRNLIPALGVSTEFVTPFTMLYLEDHPARHLKRSTLFAQTKCEEKSATSAAIAHPVEKTKRLKIGYFSGDFHSHPVTRLIVKMLALHDRFEFEIHAFSFGVVNRDDMHARLVNSVDAFHDVHEMPDKDIAELARSKGIDIAIDLTGYTHNGRWGILACRPAPIQISYLGYPGSMGADFIDYLIADHILIPEENQQFYSEKIVYMPHCYQVSDNSRVSSQINITRTGLGLPDTGFVFCCLNTNYKITSREFDIWMRLLDKVKGSVLWLQQSNNWSSANLKKEAQTRGIEPSRLVFSENCEYPEYLMRMSKADLFLDTFNFNAGAMANDALWCGLPIVTCQGQSYVARMGSSLLSAIDLPELITTNERDYEELALDLATNPKRLERIKAKLTINKESTPVFNTERFTRNIETAYTQIYSRYFAGETPENLYINESKIH